MAVFRDGVKIGKFDVRTGLSKKRVQDLAKKHGLIDDPNKSPSLKAYGELDAIRAVIARQEGFMRPNSFHVVFNPPKGMHNFRATKRGSLEQKLMLLNKSNASNINSGFKAANAPAGEVGGQNLDQHNISKLNIMCSKVTMPEKTFDVGLYRHYGPSYAYPKAIQFGTLSTTFYADGVMEIKNFFDQWQTLVYNTLSGNFNYYNEYTSSFDIFSTTTVGDSVKKSASEPQNTAQKIAQTIQNATQAVDEFFGSNDTRIKKDRFNVTRKNVDNYGVRIFDCWPQTVSQIELDHGSNDAIGTFDVTWAYSKWVPFGFSGISPRGSINLSIGEFRMEKDGIPFIEDLPPELAGPLSGAIDQGISTAPIGGITKGKIFF